jgi:hypothetical protein
MVGGEWFRDDEGWYASNNYYFGVQRAAPFRRGSHTESGTTQVGKTSSKWSPKLESSTQTGGGTPSSTVQQLPALYTTLKDKLDEKHFSDFEQDVYQLWGIDDIEDLHDLSFKDLEDLGAVSPKCAALMIVHLLQIIEGYKDQEIETINDDNEIEAEYEDISCDVRSVA